MWCGKELNYTSGTEDSTPGRLSATGRMPLLQTTDPRSRHSKDMVPHLPCTCLDALFLSTPSTSLQVRVQGNPWCHDQSKPRFLSLQRWPKHTSSTHLTISKSLLIARAWQGRNPKACASGTMQKWLILQAALYKTTEICLEVHLLWPQPYFPSRQINWSWAITGLILAWQFLGLKTWEESTAWVMETGHQLWVRWWGEPDKGKHKCPNWSKQR